MPNPIPYPGGFRCNFRDPRGHQIRRRFPASQHHNPKRACQEYIDAILGDKPSHYRLDLKSLVHEYLVWAESTHAKAHSTIRSDRQRLSAFVTFCQSVSQGNACDLNVNHIRAFEKHFWHGGTWYKPNQRRQNIDALSGVEGPSLNSHRNLPHASVDRSNTWNHYLFALCAFFRWSIERGYLERSPIPNKSEFLRPLPPPDIQRVYSPDELSILFASFEPRRALFYRLMAYAGLRPSEILRLQWRDINLSQGTLTIARESKSRRLRLVPLAPELLDHLRALPRRDGLIFSDNGITPLCSTQWWSRQWTNALTRSGLPHGRMYDLRHTFGSNFQLYAPIGDVQKVMGHQRVETTMRYMHTIPGHLRESIAKLKLENKKAG